MAEASIPVDLYNPGQVFACLGFLEAAEILLGDAEGGFDGCSTANALFVLSVETNCNPFESILRRLVVAELSEVLPVGWPGKRIDDALDADSFPSPMNAHYVKQDKKWSTTKLPFEIRFDNDNSRQMGHWTDGSSRGAFKLYSGNRSACTIARDMLFGKSDNSTKGVKQLVDNDLSKLVTDPFNATCTLGGSFNLDPRGGWTQIDAGFSINRHDHINVVSSPVVEVLAAFGLEHARPSIVESKGEDGSITKWQRYGVWEQGLPVALARIALSSTYSGVPMRRFVYRFAAAGKNKVNTFSREDM